MPTRLRGRTRPASAQTLLRDVWLEKDLGQEWVTAFRLVIQDGRPVIGEIRVFPRENARGREPGEWSAKHAHVPDGGITARLLRNVSLADYPTFERKLARLLEATQERTLANRVEATETRGRRREFPDRVIAEIAKLYAERVSAGSKRPVVEVARMRPESETTIRNVIHQARNAGFLSPTLQGRIGGQLTKKARRLLRRIK